MPYVPTIKQSEAWKLLREGPRNVMLEGGSRSGKTSLIFEEILCRAIKYPKTRHLMARLRFAHAKTSLWLDTIPKMLAMEGIKRNSIKINESDHYLSLPNKSEIWIDGLDDKDRVEKVLGREYNTIFFNEISQIGYQSILMVLTRLALKVAGCMNKAYYDLNPVGRAHWGYKLFIQGKDPIGGLDINNYKDYAHILINPIDNLENLPEGYIEDILDNLPEHKRKRFKDGEWGDPEGVIFKNWEIIEEIPAKVMRHAVESYGLDFGFSINPATLIWLGLLGDDLYLDELIYEPGLTNQSLGKKIKENNVKSKIYGDSAEPKSIKELQLMGINIVGAKKGADSIRQGIDWLLGKKIYVTKKSANIQLELMNYEWKTDKNEHAIPQPVDDYNHALDATRYGSEIYKSRKRLAGPILRSNRR